jgi:membrane protease YdiL (CAAX protease family)
VLPEHARDGIAAGACVKAAVAWVGRQFRLVDEAHAPGRPTDAQLAGLLVIVAAVLVLIRSVGTTEYVTDAEWARRIFDALPYPELGPKLYWAFFRVVGYAVIPGLYVRYLMGIRLSDVGLRIDTSPRVLLLYLGLFALVLPAVYAASFSPAFLRKYPLYEHAGRSTGELFAWEGAYVVQFVALEFFFRGAVLFALARRFGAQAVFVMAVPYALIHVGKPVPEALGAILTGIVLGVLALRTRSIFGGVLIHSAVGVTMDLLALVRKDELPF